MPPRLNRSHESVFAGKEPVTTHNDVAIYVTSDGRFGAELPTGDTDFAGKPITRPIYKRTMNEVKRAIDDAAGLLTPVKVMRLQHSPWQGMRPAVVGEVRRVAGRHMHVVNDGSSTIVLHDDGDEILLFDHTLASEWAMLMQQYTSIMESANRLVSQAAKVSTGTLREMARLQRLAAAQAPATTVGEDGSITDERTGTAIPAGQASPL